LLFGTAHAGFLTALVLVQHDPDLLTADIINSTLVVALAVLISHTLFTQHRRNYRHMAVIEEQSRRLERLATEDSLTKLPNRRSIAERVEQEFERSRRYGPIFAVAFADLDHFKQVNDTYSHAVGDEVLKKVAEIFRSTLRAPDVVARYGGEEFLFLFPESGASGAAAACEKIRADLEAYTWADIAPGLHMTASFGVAANVGHESPAEVIAAADRHLYEAKQGGRNCVCPVEVA
jgi:diguanylate cyclase (GGDEF)-like protein